MRTNLFKSFLVLSLLILGIGNAWGHSKHYGKATLVNATGNGTVYLSTASGSNSGQKGSSNPGTKDGTSWITWNCGEDESNDSKTYYARGTANNGYYYAGWATTSTATSYTAATTGKSFSASSDTESSPTETKIYGFFKPVTIPSVATPSPNHFDATNTATTCLDYTGTVVFTTANADAKEDFQTPTITNKSGNGNYTVTGYTYESNKVTVSYKFTGDGTYGGTNRSNSATITLTSAGGENSRTSTAITANFPNAKVNSGSCDEIPASFKASDASQADKAWTATFDVEYVDGENNFDTPTFTGADASHFTYNSMTISGNVVTVNFTYNGNKETTTHTATLTLKVKDAIGGTDATYGSKGITVTAVNEEEPDYDVEVRNAGGTLISNNTTTWAQGLDLANNNAGSTIKLMRNVNLGTITATNNINKAMTIDLNGKELRAAVDTKQVGVLTINANVAVTIKDSKTGGRIINEHSKNAVLYTINVAQGTLNLESGTISIHNNLQQSYGTTATGGVATSIVAMGARAIQQAAATTVNINGGRVESYGTRAVYGIRTEGSKANTTTLNISGGEIYAEAPAYVYAVFSNGKLNVSGGTITAKINNEVVNENTAYMEYIRTNNKLWDNRTYGLRGFGYGILLQGGNSVTATSNYFGTLNMTGGTVNVINVGDPEMQAKSTATDFIQSPLYGVYFNAAALNVKTGTASDGSYSQKYAAKGSITGGTISVSNSGRQSYGVYVMGHYNSFDNTSAPVVVKNCTINVSSYYESYGVYANATIGTTSDNASPNMGACYAGEVELTGATVTATTTTAATAYALFAHAATGIVYKNATWTKAKAAGYTQVYDGEFGAAAKITVNSGTYTATSATTTAYAVGSTTRAKTVWSSETSTAANKTLGGNAEAYPELILHGGTFRGETGTTTSGAVLSGGYTTIDGGTYTAYSGSTTSRGIYATAGTLDVSNVEISASGTTTAYGIDLSCGISDYTGFKYYADATLKNLTVTATTRTGNEADAVLIEVTKRPLSTTTYNALTSSNKTSYGSIYQYGEYAVGAKCSIIGGTYTATAQGANAFGVSVNSASLCEDVNGDGVLAIGEGDLTISNAKFTVSTKTGATAYGVWAGGKTSISNSTFNVTSATSTAYGLRAYYGKSTIKNSIFDVTATTETAVGLRAEARMSTVYTSNSLHTTNFSGVEGYELVGEIETEENTVTVRANGGNTAYGVQVISAKGTGTKTTADAGLAFKGDHACAGNAVINGGKYTATASGTTAYAIIVSAPATQGAETAIPSCTVNDGKFYGYATGGTYADLSPAGEPGYFVLNGGYYVKDENIDVKLGEGMNKVEVKSGTPEYTEGYRWRVTDNMTGEIVCKVYNSSNSLLKSYQTLEEALAYVNLPANSSTAMTIVMCGNYTLSKGDYSLPNGKTLLVPYKASGTGKGATQAVGTSYVWVNYETKYIKPTPLYKLTFASGVNMTVENGAAIEASSVIYITNGASGQGASLLVEGTGIVHDKYGWIDLEEGSHIDLESGSNLYVWGYITGKGEINAKNGSKIYEDFQMGDWRGGTYELKVQGNEYGLNNKGVFPITHYYYQNIECPITYRAGATAYALGGTAVNAFGATNAITNPAVQFIGTSNSMFLMDPATAGEDTWVRKEYDPETDYMNWTLNSGARIGSISLKMSAMGLDINLNSSDYVLPITSNFNIIANYGQVEISNDVCFIPGSKLTIKKEATVIIPSGKRVYFYDQDDWKSYGGYWFNPGYSPSWKTNPRRVLGANTSIKMPDAAVLVEGVLDIRGYAYTTAGGANIYSTRENAGKVKFTAAAPASTSAEADFTSGTHNSTLYQWTASNVNSDGNVHFEGKALNAPWLKNEDGAFSETTGTTTNKTWIYMEDDDHVYRWILSYEDGCFTYKNNGGGEKQLIHPSDWVAAESNTNGDHAYHSEDGTRMFVNAKAATSSATCVWWEVDPTPEVISGTTYYVANNENFDNYGTYFYWDNATSYWKPKKITVTWNNWDGSKLTNGTYGDAYNFNTSPVYQGTNPTKANTTTEKYDWIGWRDAEGNIYDRNATLPRATSDVVYTAYFVATKYQHTITFKNKDDNKVIWSGLMDAGTTPVCPVAPTQDPTVAWVYTFTNWEGYAANADLPTVTEPATYTAIYSSAPRQYTVTFYNYDAASVLYETDVNYNTRPVYAGVTPFRANTSAYSYEWTGWQQGSNTYDTDDDLAFVTGDVYYVATFAQTELKYQVLFKRQDGSIIDAPFFNYEETPVAFPANPTLASTVSTDYTFDHWDPATLTPVTEDGKVYTAYFSGSPRKYTAHFVNYNGTSLSADQTIDYNTVPAYTGAAPIKPNDSRNSYEFSGWAWEAGADWEAGSIGVGEAFPAIKGDITFTAQYTPTLLQFDVIYQREDGFVILRDKKKWGESSAFPTTYAGATSGLNYEDATYSYTFGHWSPATVVNPVTTDATYTAYYNRSIKTYSITAVGISPAGYGTVSPASLASIPGGSTVTVNGNEITVNGTIITATPAAATAQYTYAFDHWNNVPATVTSNISDIEAVFTRTVNNYTVTWKNADGTTLEIDENVAYGTTPTYNGATPTKTATAEYTYTFTGWDNTPVAVTGDATYNATFSSTKNSYEITWLNDDNSLIDKTTVEYGVVPTHADATKVNTAEYTYTFTGWDNTPVAVTGAATYKATFSAAKNSYEITWLNDDNSLIDKTTVEYGIVPTHAEATKANTASNCYTFAGWDSEIVAVTGEKTYKATFSASPTVASVTVGGATTYYATLQAAFDYAAGKTTPTIKVLADIALTAKVTYTNTSKTTVTIDLNGHTVSGALNPLLTLTSATSTGGLIVIKSSVEGGQIRNVVNSNAARACVVLSKGKLRFESGKIYMENKSTSSSVQAYGIQVGSSRTFTMIDGTVEVKSTKHAYAIYSYGTTNIEGGELIVTETKNGYAAGVHVVNGTATISENPTITVSGTKYAYGVRVGGLTPAINSGKTAVTMYNGVANIEGGTYTVTASTNTAYGVYCYGNTFKVDYTTNATLAGNYANGGTANVRGGVFEVTSGGATAYGVCLQTPATIQTALDADGNATYDAATTQPKANITGGKFNVSGASSVGAVNTAAANTDLIVEGGWYNDATNLATKYTAPAKNCNYHVLPLTGEDPYKYEVAEAYQLAWNLDGGTVVTAGTQAPVDATGTPSGYVAKGATLTAPVVEKSGFTFAGWSDGSSVVTPATTMPSANTTYTATWTVAESGFWLDIVDVDNSAHTLTINTNSWASSGWPYTINDVEYQKTARETDRTLVIPYTEDVGKSMTITVQKTGGDIVSKHNYIVPAAITGDAALGDQQMIFVKPNITLTVDADKIIKNIYVAPGAKLVVNSGKTLTADTVFLRTKPWLSAELELNGTITGQVCYTRIIKDRSQYFQFGLPLSCPISSVHLSDGTTPAYGSAWILRSYSESSRAANGANGANWIDLAAGGTIAGGVGYEMFSASNYYREFLFPVDLGDLTTNVAVSHTTGGAAGNTHAGWNIIVSPLMSTYTIDPEPEGWMISWLQEDGSYSQEPATTIKPAIPFSYQAEANGSLSFDSEFSVVTAAPRRRMPAAQEPERIQWLQLDITDNKGNGDQTGIYSHPIRYENAYKTGIDVAKQSFSASRALIYSSHAYGEMAFAGVPDAQLEDGVSLTVYSPKEQELTISMRDNEWLNRMAFVWLIDNATGAQIDLLDSDYTFEATAGTTAGRFILMGRFFAPQIATDIDEVDGEQVKPKKLIIRDKLYILINDQLYDGTGKIVK